MVKKAPSIPAAALVFLSLQLIGVTVCQRLQERRLDIEDEDGSYREPPEPPSTPEPVYPDGVNTIPGEAVIHYPVYEKIFRTSFSCANLLPGFYADIEARCQIWHICGVDGRIQSFLCTNGTIFSQETRVCEWWYNTNCDENFVRQNYDQNKDLYHTKNQKEESREDAISLTGNRQTHQPQEFEEKPKFSNQAPTHAGSRNSASKHSNQEVQGRSPYSEPRQENLTFNLEKKLRITNEVRNPPESQPAFSRSASQRSRQTVNPQKPKRVNQQRTPVEQRSRNLQSQSSNHRRQFNGRREGQQLTQEQLEQRRQAARDKFYFVPAKVEQEKRQQRLQEQQRLINHPPPTPSSPPPRRPQPSTFESESRNLKPESDSSLVKSSQQNVQVGISHHQKFRHSTPRKHNVKFRPSPRDSQERQIPEESQQNGFPFYNQQFTTRRVSTQKPTPVTPPKISPKPTQYLNQYLPTTFHRLSTVRPTVPETQRPVIRTKPAPVIRRRTRKRRPRPAKKQNEPKTTSVPLPHLSYKPPALKKDKLRAETKIPYKKFEEENRIPHFEQSRIIPRPRNSAARIVIKTKLRNKKPIIHQPKQDNVNVFPGNPHLEQKVNNEFQKAHAAQKRCAVVGSGNTFKVLC